MVLSVTGCGIRPVISAAIYAPYSGYLTIQYFTFYNLSDLSMVHFESTLKLHGFRAILLLLRGNLINQVLR